MKFYENKKNQVVAMASTGAIMVSLFFGSGYLYVNNNDLKKDIQEKQSQVSSLTDTKTKLETEVKTIGTELTGFKGKNAELDKLLTEANSELEKKRVRIEKLMKENASLSKVKKEVEELKKMKVQYAAQVRNLESRISELSRENEYLKSDNEKLKLAFNDLSNKNSELQKKVEIASVLRVENVLVAGMKKTKKAFVPVTKSSKTERVNMSFDLVENKVADIGPKNIYIRILDPKGKTLPSPSTESGNFSNLDNNINLPYTALEVVEYNKTKKRVTVNYDVKGAAFEKGTYKVEFYCDGYFCGSSQLKLK
ncbi:MAG: hypothetical protein ACK40G_07145 [Cytophagaceae bacterium]